MITDSKVRSSPVLDSIGNIYFGTWINDNRFYAVDSGGSAVTGWPTLTSTEPSAPYPQVDGTPAIDETNNVIYYNSMFTSGGKLHALRPDGSQKWGAPFDLLGPSFSSPTVWDPAKGGDGTIYISSNGPANAGYLFAVNPNGTQKWRYDFSFTDPISKPAIGPDGTVYIGSDDNHLYAIDANGDFKWRFQAGADVRGEPLVGSGGAIYFGSQDNFLYAVDTEGRLLGKYDLGAIISVPDPDAADYTWESWKYSASGPGAPRHSLYGGRQR